MVAVGRRHLHHVLFFFSFCFTPKLSILRPALLFDCPSPHGQESTPPIPAALPENKRDSVRRHPLDLFHTPAPTPLPDGSAFFQGLSEPQESSKMDVHLPLSPLFSCPSPTCSLCHAPPCPEHAPFPPSRPTLAASSFRIINHLLALARRKEKLQIRCLQ